MADLQGLRDQTLYQLPDFITEQRLQIQTLLASNANLTNQMEHAKQQFDEQWLANSIEKQGLKDKHEAEILELDQLVLGLQEHLEQSRNKIDEEKGRARDAALGAQLQHEEVVRALQTQIAALTLQHTEQDTVINSLRTELAAYSSLSAETCDVACCWTNHIQVRG